MSKVLHSKYNPSLAVAITHAASARGPWHLRATIFLRTCTRGVLIFFVCARGARQSFSGRQRVRVPAEHRTPRDTQLHNSCRPTI